VEQVWRNRRECTHKKAWVWWNRRECTHNKAWVWWNRREWTHNKVKLKVGRNRHNNPQRVHFFFRALVFSQVPGSH
jgi:hypothetical protein